VADLPPVRGAILDRRWRRSDRLPARGVRWGGGRGKAGKAALMRGMVLGTMMVSRRGVRLVRGILGSRNVALPPAKGRSRLLIRRLDRDLVRMGRLLVVVVRGKLLRLAWGEGRHELRRDHTKCAVCVRGDWWLPNGRRDSVVGRAEGGRRPRSVRARRSALNSLRRGASRRSLPHRRGRER
jgi:hypothetical protein